jgi:hypothetical protein
VVGHRFQQTQQAVVVHIECMFCNETNGKQKMNFYYQSNFNQQPTIVFRVHEIDDFVFSDNLVAQFVGYEKGWLVGQW